MEGGTEEYARMFVSTGPGFIGNETERRFHVSVTENRRVRMPTEPVVLEVDLTRCPVERSFRRAVRGAPKRELDNAAVECCGSSADWDEPRGGALFEEVVN